MSKQPGKPRLVVYKLGDDWHFAVREVTPESRILRYTAWGFTRHYLDTWAAGQSALRRELTKATPEEPKKEPEPATTERPFLTAGSHLASSERRWSFGFSTAPEAWV